MVTRNETLAYMQSLTVVVIHIDFICRFFLRFLFVDLQQNTVVQQVLWMISMVSEPT